jgi:hypothetical protein
MNHMVREMMKMDWINPDVGAISSVCSDSKVK